MEDETITWRADVAEAYLKPLRSEGRRLRRMRAEVLEQRSLYDGLRGIDYSQPFVDKSSYDGAVHDAAMKSMDMEKSYWRALDELDGRRAEARTCLDDMGGTYADLLRLFYVSALPWVAVGEALNLSEGTCKNMRRPALAAFYDHMPLSERPPLQGAL